MNYREWHRIGKSIDRQWMNEDQVLTAYYGKAKEEVGVR